MVIKRNIRSNYQIAFRLDSIYCDIVNPEKTFSLAVLRYKVASNILLSRERLPTTFYGADQHNSPVTGYFYHHPVQETLSARL